MVRMPSSKPIEELPYKARVYINNQVLLPARLVKALGIEWAKYAEITIKYKDCVITLKQVALLRTRHTASRQFTIPKEVRDKYGIMPLDEIEVIGIRPLRNKEINAKQVINE